MVLQQQQQRLWEAATNVATATTNAEAAATDAQQAAPTGASNNTKIKMELNTEEDASVMQLMRRKDHLHHHHHHHASATHACRNHFLY